MNLHPRRPDEGPDDAWPIHRAAPVADPRKRSQRIRVAFLLSILAGVGVYYLWVKYQENWTPDWDHRQRVAVILLIPTDPDEDEQRLLKTVETFSVGSDKSTFTALEQWFQRERARYAPGADRPVWLEVLGPSQVDSLPPPPPRAGAELSFTERYKQTRAFLDYYQAQRERHQPEATNVVFVTFYRPEDKGTYGGVHSVADRRSRSGFVFCELSEEGIEVALINVGHELLHLFGASDKYVGERCVYPQGFYAPFKDPRFPQEYAEVMAQGIPTGVGAKEASLDFFSEMRVGVETAYEIGWVDRARRDRYYQQRDTSAGPIDEE